MPNAKEDLRATSDSIQEDAARLKELEAEEARLDADDPRIPDLSRRIERLAHVVAEKTTVERVLADELQRG